MPFIRVEKKYAQNCQRQICTGRNTEKDSHSVACNTHHRHRHSNCIHSAVKRKHMRPQITIHIRYTLHTHTHHYIPWKMVNYIYIMVLWWRQPEITAPFPSNALPPDTHRTFTFVSAAFDITLYVLLLSGGSVCVVCMCVFRATLMAEMFVHCRTHRNRILRSLAACS